VEPADVVFTGHPEEGLRATDVGPEEGARVVDGAVDVRLGGEVDDDVAARHRLVHGGLVADVGLDHRDAVRHRRQAGPVTGVGEGVDDGHVVVGMGLHHVVNEVGADESGAAGDEQAHGLKVARTTIWSWKTTMARPTSTPWWRNCKPGWRSGARPGSTLRASRRTWRTTPGG